MKKLLCLVVSLLTCLAMACIVTGCGEQVTKVTFDSVGGSSVSETSITLDSNYVLTEPTKAGYDFGGWKYESNAVESSGKWNIDEDEITLTATWIAKEYTITLLGLDGVTGVTSNQVTVKTGEIPALPSNISKTGHNFVQWKYGTETFSTTSAFNYAKNITVTAEWSAINYTITLNANGGQIYGSKSVKVAYGQIPNLPEPMQAGKTFNGWKYNEEDFVEGVEWKLTKNITLVAQWVDKKYSVTINNDNGEENTVISNKLYNDTVLNLLPTENPTKTGYTFDKYLMFTPNSSEGVEINNETVITSSVEIRALWIANDYTLTVNALGGTGLKNTAGDPVDTLEITVTFGKIPNIPILEKDGYLFNGYKKDEQVFDVTKAWSVADDVVLNAVWLAKEYLLTLDLDGGEIRPEFNKVIAVTSGEDYTAKIDTPTRTGYNFIKWQKDGVDFDVTTAWNLNENATIIAVWEEKEYLINLDVNGGTIEGETQITVKYNKTYVVNTPKKTAYTFLGWYKDNKEFDVTTAWTLDETGITLIAMWAPTQYTVICDEDGGEDVEDISYNVKSQNVTVLDIEKDGYVFGGWFGVKNVAGTNYYVGQDYFDKLFEDGVADETLAKTSLSELDKSNAVTTIYANKYALYIGNGTLVAKWTAKQYNVSFNLNGGTGTTETVTATYDKPLEVQDPTFGNLIFVGWTYNGELVNKDAFDVNVENGANITLVASWKSDVVSQVKLYMEEGSNEAYKTIDTYVGVALFEIEDPVKEGYTFMGWKLNDSDEIVYLPGQLINCPEAQTNLYAVWQLNSYKIKIRLDAGEVLKLNGEKVAARNEGVYEYVIEVKYGAEFDISGYVVEIPNFTQIEGGEYEIIGGSGKENCEFVGFKYVDGGQDFVVSGEWTADKDAVIEAKWKDNSGDSWTGNH